MPSGLPSSPIPPTYSSQPYVATPIKPNLNTSYSSYASPDQRTINLSMTEASRLTDEVLHKKKSPYMERQRRGGGGPPTDSSMFNTTAPPNAAFGNPLSPSHNTTQHQVVPYQVAPFISHGIFEHRHHRVEEKTAGVETTICDMPWSNSTIRVRDAVKALKLEQIKDEWTEELRDILGKHLLSVLKM